ncbi:MAG TPA: hypothetical protein ENI65_03185 [Gammaproteobacteria bacterium]|nr:hypothetical protein [Gammaproteobacteria bacterium]
MVGKKNIVFGFIYLVLTASLGPYMIVKMSPDIAEAGKNKQTHVGNIQQIEDSDFENPETMEPLTAKQIAMANSRGILALSRLDIERGLLNDMKGGPHAHGNLEAVLNILAGLMLLFLAAPVMIKQAISWLFILGAILHSGMLYLRAFDVGFAGKLLYLGPWTVLLALLLAGVAAAVWLKPEIVSDN